MKIIYVFVFVFVAFIGFGQTKQDYIYNYAALAVAEMEATRIPASITLAQGILESRFGTSELSSKSNNHFGIKCHKSWSGKSVKYDDDAKDECFRKYSSAAESYRDHSLFLSTRGRYSDLFKLSIYDYKGWAKGLRKAGYATNPKYADHLIKIIEEEQLYVFDRMNLYEVEPYIASLKNNVAPDEVFVMNVADRPANIEQKTEQTVSVQPKVVTVQGGPAAAPERIVSQSRDIFIENQIKTVFTFSEDTPAKLSAMYNIPLKRLYKYNEWPEYLNEFTWGMKVYLQPKRNKSRDVSQLFHKVKPGESMYQIAQHYGLKTNKLYKWNLMNIEKKEQPRAGELISLRKKLKTKPLLRRPQDQFSVDQMPQQEPDTAIEVQDDKLNRLPQRQTQEKVETNVETPIKPESDKLWDNYPSTKTVEPVTTPQQEKENPVAPQSQQTKNQVATGRSIIYDSTPEVNRQPVKAYQPKSQKKPNQASTILNPQPSTPKALQYHTVVKGDTLYGLAKKYSVSVPQIKEWNNLTTNTIKVGQKLIVKQ